MADYNNLRDLVNRRNALKSEIDDLQIEAIGRHFIYKNAVSPDKYVPSYFTGGVLTIYGNKSEYFEPRAIRLGNRNDVSFYKLSNPLNAKGVEYNTKGVALGKFGGFNETFKDQVFHYRRYRDENAMAAVLMQYFTELLTEYNSIETQLKKLSETPKVTNNPELSEALKKAIENKETVSTGLMNTLSSSTKKVSNLLKKNTNTINVLAFIGIAGTIIYIKKKQK